MSELTAIYTSNTAPKVQNQLQWLNWKLDELYRKKQDLEASTNAVRKASANMVAQEIQMLQDIGRSLEKCVELGNLLKHFTQ